ncbi:bifunctional riboflavin kinase/FAD synthetase [Zoogloea sp.]|jgi:riboflavin kinase/FMN adenylyltransferase|uniref:bifunctional riboflavin kinase/FAD synthetase n=1 Tax=Zoogloea sp. TaxID=49181 RepID=UPI001B3CD597|nr:bifunctional riboflavin kinase/FAD synthetase [Zoogloea sp.]MBK6653624.1 bifunctional riboflavin kinase/FAD synthetase [Zoogloea sp.]MBP7444086.1 bifunctional riboflavin kinase/FAD synthetase [Zoogloea sp.]HPI59353.1 bifunctional riboflavin kinase/FAD synthetase [Zoogloea sp.]
MQVFRGIPERSDHGCVLTIGNFDGVHRGHQALLAKLRAKSRANGLPSAVLTFEPHPREYFTHENRPIRLTSLREKIQRIADQGVDRLYIGRFNARFAALTAEQFIEEILVRGLGARHLMIGDDFRFGKGRQGDFALLEATGKTAGFTVEAMHTLVHEGERVSSSAVREALAEGDMPHAARLLGHPYSISGRVMHGDKIGRSIGFPTANIQLKHRSPPLMGIYTVSVEGLVDTPWPGVASVGVRPTINDAGRPTLEVHLFDWKAECYGAHLKVNFLAKQRDEERYDTLEALTAQIARDADQARAYFAQNPL